MRAIALRPELAAAGTTSSGPLTAYAPLPDRSPLPTPGQVCRKPRPACARAVLPVVCGLAAVRSRPVCLCVRSWPVPRHACGWLRRTVRGSARRCCWRSRRTAAVAAGRAPCGARGRGYGEQVPLHGGLPRRVAVHVGSCVGAGQPGARAAGPQHRRRAPSARRAGPSCVCAGAAVVSAPPLLPVVP